LRDVVFHVGRTDSDSPCNNEPRGVMRENKDRYCGIDDFPALSITHTQLRIALALHKNIPTLHRKPQKTTEREFHHRRHPQTIPLIIQKAVQKEVLRMTQSLGQGNLVTITQARCWTLVALFVDLWPSFRHVLHNDCDPEWLYTDAHTAVHGV
jgi:hypothetical protein